MNKFNFNISDNLELHNNDKIVLKALTRAKKKIEDLALETRLKKDAIFRAIFTLQELGLANVEKKEEKFYSLTDEGKIYLEKLLPEQRAALKKDIKDLTEDEKKIGIGYAIKNGWIEIKFGKINLKVSEDEIKNYPLYHALKNLSGPEDAMKTLLNRGLIKEKIKKEFFASITDEGEKFSKTLKIEKEIVEITREEILSGVENFKRFNVEAPVEKPRKGRPHPLSVFINKIRRIFLNMGFVEMEGPEIESAFWNFDALFQPQDHPARDLHDTFYLSDPKYIEPPKDALEKVRKQHEKFWTFSDEVASRAILRSHTTAVSARTLYEIGKNEKKPGKYFCIGRVYRNEAIDFSHLPEFYQVEGIVVWEGANFRHLLGFLKEFYRNLGFRKIKFVPHHFPYTEPSLEIHVYFEKKKRWFELGGAGIFRPELSLPLWGKYPVLAWGLSVERPMMLIYDIDDIRDFYMNDFSWIEKIKV